MLKGKKFYYLGATTADGFVSFFPDCYNYRLGDKAYILKGGAGTGKSTLMKKAAATAEKKGMQVIYCPCSSDPSSLDGVIFPEIRTVILDGTSPHIIEPKMPGVCEQIVNLGEAFKKDGFSGNEKEIIALCDKNKACHKSAAGYMSAAGKLLLDARRLTRECADSGKTIKAALSLCDRIIPKRYSLYGGLESFRFISTPTVNGTRFLSETITAEAEQFFVLEDEYRAVAPFILDILKEKAKASGYSVITLLNPYLPSKVADHIIIPELKTAVCTHSRYTPLSNLLQTRMIHSRRFTDVLSLRNIRPRLKFDRRAANEMIDSAVKCITEAKAIHDQIEKYYINAIDFAIVDKITQDVIAKIFN